MLSNLSLGFNLINQIQGISLELRVSPLDFNVITLKIIDWLVTGKGTHHWLVMVMTRFPNICEDLSQESTPIPILDLYLQSWS